MAFHEVRFPPALSFGASGGPERRVEIVTLASGHEARNGPRAGSRRRYDAGVGLRALDDLEALVAFFEARGGALHGFRWKDWADYRSAPASVPVGPGDQRLGTGDGVRRVFALRKGYGSGDQVYWRGIDKPVAGSVQVAVGNDVRPPGVDWVVDVATGLVSFADPPAPGAEVTAGFEFDVPVRFDTDRIEVSLASFKAGSVPRVPVLEVRV